MTMSTGTDDPGDCSKPNNTLNLSSAVCSQENDCFRNIVNVLIFQDLKRLYIVTDP